MSEKVFSASAGDLVANVVVHERMIKVSGVNLGMVYGAAKECSSENAMSLVSQLVAALKDNGATNIGIDLVTGEVIVTGTFGANFITILTTIIPVALPLILGIIQDIQSGKKFFEILIARLPQIIQIIQAIIPLFNK